MDKGKKIVSKSPQKGVKMYRADKAKKAKAAKGSSKGGGSKSGKTITSQKRMTKGIMDSKPIPSMSFKDLQAARTMQDKPAALSIMRKEKPTKAQGYPNPITKGGKAGYELTDLPNK
jgi:hypothetical protein